MKKINLLISLVLISSCAAIDRAPGSKLAAIAEADSLAHGDKQEDEQINAVLGDQADSESTDHHIFEKADTYNFITKKFTKRVDYWIEYFSKKQKDRFQRFVNNGRKYKEYIMEVFEEHGLPKELYYVGLIESGYYLGSRSHASAVGPWQFIRETGKRYGLTINQYIDERRSIHKSTVAAALYFRDLYNIFGSWELALAAYNAGEYGIMRRIKKGGTRDYYQLTKRGLIPKETRNYVPKVLAAMTVYEGFEKYNINMPALKDPYQGSALYNVSKQVSLNYLAKETGITVKQIKELNPDLIGYYTPRLYRRAFQIRLPKGSYKMNQILAQYTPSSTKSEAKAIQKTSFHSVKAGESLWSISKKYRISYKYLQKINNYPKKIYPGQKISITKNTNNRIAQNKTSLYRVKSGDNLHSIAKKHGITLRELKSLNNMKKNIIYPGQKLKITGMRTYKVQPGDHLTKISTMFNTTIADIKSLNDLSRNIIYPGQELKIRAN